MTKSDKKKQPLIEIDEDLDMNNAQIKVTLYLEGRVLFAAKKAAKEAGIKYQPFINKVLKQVLLGKSEEDLAERVSKLERAVKRLSKSKTSA